MVAEVGRKQRRFSRRKAWCCGVGGLVRNVADEAVRLVERARKEQQREEVK